MDDICIWIRKLLAWVDRAGPPAIAYAGRAGGGYANPPAPQIEISYLISPGVRDLQLGDRRVDIPAQHVALHNVHLGAYTPFVQRLDSWCLFLDVEGGSEFSSLEQTPLFCVAPVTHAQEVQNAFAHLSTACARFGTGPLHYLAPEPLYAPKRDAADQPTAVIHVKAALLELLALLLDETAPVSHSRSASMPPPIQRAIEYISLHYSRPELDLPAIAAAARLSVDHFGRLFRQHLHETPMRFLKRTRVNQARYLLEHTELLVEEVAREVGFTDAFHFSRVMKKTTGKSPSEWR